MGTIRPVSLGDAEALAAIYAPYVRDTVISFEETPPTAAEFAQRIEAVTRTYPYLVFEEDEAPIGYAYAAPFAERAAYRWSVAVAVYVGPGAQRRGIGRRLYGALLPILARQGFRAAYAGIALPNPASVGLHEAMGFALVAAFPEIGFKRGAWLDVGWWRLALQGAGADGGAPAEPIPFASLD